MQFRHELPPPPPERGVSGLDLVIMRASTDADFRRWLLADPRAAIETTFGIRLPTTLRLRFTEKDPDVDIHVVLPASAPTPLCLSDEQLREVGGGRQADPGDWLGSTRPLSSLFLEFAAR